MTERIKVSVVVPIYNAEGFLRECLDSLVNQTLRDIEIICVDDGSTDRSGLILSHYRQEDRRITLIRQENSGSGAARNRGIRSARGEYIAFLDADDFYPEAETLEKLYEAAVRHGVLICGGSFSVLWPDGTVVTQFDEARYWGYTFFENGLRQYRDYQFDFGYHRFLYRREFLLEKGLFFPSYQRYQDPPFFVRTMTLRPAGCELPLPHGHRAARHHGEPEEGVGPDHGLCRQPGARAGAWFPAAVPSDL